MSRYIYTRKNTKHEKLCRPNMPKVQVIHNYSPEAEYTASSRDMYNAERTIMMDPE